MSMWLNYAKVDPATYAKLAKDPALVEPLFFDSERPVPAGFDKDKDVFGEDYRTLSEVIEAVEASGGDTAWLHKALGESFGDEIAYGFCYGDGFGFDVAAVKKLATGLGAEPDPFGIADFFAAAAKEGKAVVGGVS